MQLNEEDEGQEDGLDEEGVQRWHLRTSTIERFSVDYTRMDEWALFYVFACDILFTFPG